jgi:hypothetical protein
MFFRSLTLFVKPFGVSSYVDQILRSRLTAHSDGSEPTYTACNGYVEVDCLEWKKGDGRMKFAEHNCYLVGDQEVTVLAS